MSRALRDCKKNISEIDHIILVGGSGKMPPVHKYLEHIIGKKPLTGIDPDKAIGMGAGIVAAIKERNEDVKDTVLTDICPFSLGIAVHNPNGDDDLFSPIIERNAYLPSSRKRTYYTMSSAQTHVNLRVYQGESILADKNIFLGEFDIHIPPLPNPSDEKTAIDVRFTYDINGLLEVDAAYRKTDTYNNTTIVINNASMSPEEIEKRRKALQKLKIAPRDDGENRMLIAWAQRLFEESWGGEREIIAMRLENFEHLIAGNTHATEVLRARKSFASFLKQVEGFDDGLLGDDADE